MKPTKALHDLGQSIWLDYITRAVLSNGTLARYISDLHVTGLTSNPTIFDNAIKGSQDYDASIQSFLNAGRSGENLFFDIALEDLTRAADLFRPTHEATLGLDGWVSLEVSPLLAYDAAKTIEQAADLFRRGGRPNLFIKIPGTPEGCDAIEESIFNGVPINVTLLFSRDHYLACAEAYMRGIERRIAAGRSVKVGSVASVFVSRWDKATMGKGPETLRNRLGYAVSLQVYQAYRELLQSERWRKLAAVGAQPQRLLWGSTGTKDPSASDVMYVEDLAAPDTINTMPEETLLAFADHGKLRGPMPADGGDAPRLLGEFEKAGVDVDALAATLQREGAEAFSKSWNNLMSVLDDKASTLRKAS